MEKSGVERIDKMLDGSDTTPLTVENSVNQKEAVGIMQDLLVCHGAKGIPNVRGSGYGVFGSATVRRLKEFRLKYELQAKNGPVQLDSATLMKLISEPAENPRANRGYVSLKLDFRFSGLMKVISFVTIAEGGGRFDAFNANTDKQGLSFGIIQWAQKPGRLKELLEAFQGPPGTPHRRAFNSIFTATGDGMVTHTEKPNGGVDKKTGVTTDPNFNLIDPLWKNRFIASARTKPFQQIQTGVARVAFLKSVKELRKYVDPRIIHSERAFAFMLDLANQHGDAGTKNIYKKLPAVPGMDEDKALKFMQDKSVEIVRKKYPPPAGKTESNEEKSTKDRREFFRTTDLLSKITDFDETEPPPPPPLPLPLPLPILP